MEKSLPPIPAKRYFTIGEVSDLCGVKPYVLRYWEQEFTQLRPMKRGGNRRYYQHHEVLLIRRIRELLWDQGYTIQGARSQLDDRSHRADSRRLAAAAGLGVQPETAGPDEADPHRDMFLPEAANEGEGGIPAQEDMPANPGADTRHSQALHRPRGAAPGEALNWTSLRDELIDIQHMLDGL